MKRFFFMTIALAAAAVSCTKGGLLESPQNYEAPITFEPYTGKAPVTKAEIVTTEDIAEDGFRVIGFDVANSTIKDKAKPYLKKVVTSKDEGTNWTYTGAMYWQANQTLSFVAYGLNANTNTVKDEDTGDITAEGDNFVQKADTDFTVFTYTVPDDVADQKDLVISPFVKDKNSTNTTIEIPLYHVLSRVGFQLKIEGTDGINVIIKNLTLKGTGYDSADFDLTKSVVVTPAEGETPASVAYKKTFAQPTTAIVYSLFDSAYKYNKESEGSNTELNYPGFIVESDTIEIEKDEATGQDKVDNDGNPVTRPKAHIVPICKSTTTFTPDTKDVTYNLAAATASAPTEAQLANRYMMFLPQTFTDGKVEVVYQMEGGVEQYAELPITTEFKAGKAYEFIFTISTTAVNFDVIVNTWDADHDKYENEETLG